VTNPYTPLTERMRAYVEAHPTASEVLLRHVEALEGITAKTPVPIMVGIWAKARLAWRDVTGEPLV
jgi:hypothetical protein